MPETLNIQDVINQRKRVTSVKNNLSTSTPDRISIDDFVKLRKQSSEPIQNQGFVKTLAKEVGTPFARLGVNISRIPEAFRGASSEQLARPVNVPLFGEVKPIGQEGSFGEKVKDTAGVGVEIASNIPFFRAGKVVGLGVKQGLKRGATIGAKEGAVGGTLFGTGRELQQEDATVGSVLKEGVISGGFGLVGGGALGGLGAGIGAGIRGVRNREKIARNQIVDEFNKTFNKYTKSRTILESTKKTGSDPVKIISSYGDTIPKILDDSMENGSVNSKEAIDFMKSKISELSNLKTEVVIASNEAVPVDNLFKEIVKLVESRKGWSKVYKDKVLRQIAPEATSIRRVYGDNMLLDEIDLIKTEQTRLSKSYKRTNRPEPFILDAHGIIGKASRNIVENVTKDAPTKELNKLIQSHYDAMDLLFAINGNTPNGGRFSKVLGGIGGQTVGVVTGASAGHPILGAIAGRVGSEIIFNILGNKFISNPLKRSLIKGLKDVEPDVIQKALQFLDEAAKEKAGRLRLPAKSSVNSPGPTIKVAPKDSSLDFVGKGTFISDFKPPQRSVPKSQLNIQKPIDTIMNDSTIPIKKTISQKKKKSNKSVKTNLGKPKVDKSLIEEARKFDTAKDIFNKAKKKSNLGTK